MSGEKDLERSTAFFVRCNEKQMTELNALMERIREISDKIRSLGSERVVPRKKSTIVLNSLEYCVSHLESVLEIAERSGSSVAVSGDVDKEKFMDPVTDVSSLRFGVEVFYPPKGSGIVVLADDKKVKVRFSDGSSSRFDVAGILSGETVFYKV